jgi:DNA polymerase III delta subunit
MKKKKKREKSASLLPEASRFITIIVIGSKYNKNKKKRKKIEAIANIGRYLSNRNLSVNSYYY